MEGNNVDVFTLVPWITYRLWKLLFFDKVLLEGDDAELIGIWYDQRVDKDRICKASTLCGVSGTWLEDLNA